MLKVILAIPVLLATIAGLTYLLREKNGSDIRVVWYLFSLTALITFGVAGVAINVGAVQNGQFIGEYGALLNSLLGFMLDLEKDFMIVAGITSLVMVPQIACYILSGLSGNAKSPILINASFSFLVWGVIKSLVVCSAIIFSVGFLCLFGYLTESRHNTLFFFGTGPYVLLLAFGILSVYREGELFAHYLGKRAPCLRLVHEWFTRKEKASELDGGADDVDLLEVSQSLLSVASEIHKAAISYNTQKSCKRSS